MEKGRDASWHEQRTFCDIFETTSWPVACHPHVIIRNVIETSKALYIIAAIIVRWMA